MRNGFTFKNIHSSKFNICFSTDSRTLMPQLRRNTLTIGGRSGTYDYSHSVYEERTESLTCYFIKRDFPSTNEQSRQIAQWLSGTGPLIFDDEPNVMYTATVVNAPSLKRRAQYGEFEVQFVYNPPFGEDLTNQQSTHIGSVLPLNIIVESGGTVDTTCRVRLIARTDISSLTIAAKAETNV